MDNFIFKADSLYCEDVNIRDIAEKYGTPAYIYSKKTLEENINSYKYAFSKKDNLICFSVKSLSNLSILELLHRNGFGFDIVSGGTKNHLMLVSLVKQGLTGKAADAALHKANITVSNWGFSADSTNQIILDTIGEAVVLIWNGTKWYVVANTGATLS